MQTVVTFAVSIVFALAVCWIFGLKTKENIAILPKRTNDVQDKVLDRVENVTLYLNVLKEELLQCQTNITKVTKVLKKEVMTVLKDKVMKDLKEELLHYQKNITKVTKEEIMQGQKNITNLTKILIEEIMQCQKNITVVNAVLKEELLQCQSNITKMKDELLQIQKSINKVMDTQLYIRRDLKVLEGQDEIRNSVTISSGTVLILLFGLAAEGLIFIVIIKHLLSRQVEAHTDAIYNTNEMPQSTPSKRLGQQKKIQLHRSVCIVSFYEETQELHMMLAKSAIQTDIPIKQFLMKKHETQLMSIPRSIFVLIFVDYNKKNAILETPGQDLGDKKLVTVQAALNMGADVFVVYVKDKGSTNLPDGVLYNTNLASFTRHPTLGKLTVNGRGLSVYETFTDHQQCHINRIISGHLC